MLLDRKVRVPRSTRHLQVKRRAVEILRAMRPVPRCDRGGCRNHEGRCAIDSFYEAALLQAEDQIPHVEELNVEALQ